MPEFYTWTILLINQLDEIGEKQLSVFGSSGGQICPLMHVALLKHLLYSMDVTPMLMYHYLMNWLVYINSLSTK